MNDLYGQLSSINIFTDILVPALAALGAVLITMRKFKKERIWQDKYASYRKVLESIEAIHYWGDECNSDVHMLPAIGHFDGKTSSEYYAEAQREALKQSMIGTLLLSSQFIDKLDEFLKELGNEKFSASEEHYDSEQERYLAFGNHAAEVRNISSKYLPQLIAIARTDLGA